MLTASLVAYHHTLQELQPVLDSMASEIHSTLYIVDNGQDPQLQQDLYVCGDKRLEYIPAHNNGFGAGHNIAIRKAMKQNCDFHVILNPDIYFPAGTLKKIVDFMTEHPEIGLVMPKTVTQTGELHYDCKLLPTPWDLIAKRFLPLFLKQKRMHRFMMKDFDYNKILDVPYLCGCFMVFRREALEKAGLFDERFFMYPEDIDITRRIYSAGFRTVYYPQAEVVHAHTQASYKNFKMLRIHIVNMIRYFNKWGWIWDPERKRINREILKRNKDKLRYY